jgi:REP element-mobilizing transposase RayT
VPGKNERKMPRLPRIFVKNAAYYITCRAEIGENIFKGEEDYKMFLSLLKKYKEVYGIKIYAYALMPDHLHLLIELSKEADDSRPARSQEISDFMHNLNNAYTKYFNGRYEKKGHLLRERFKAALVERQSYLLKMTAYIHLNPKKMNLCVEAKDYPYSSYTTYLNNGQNADIDIKPEINEALVLLGNNDYAGFVAGFSEEEGEFIHKRLHRGGIVGSNEFAKLVKQEIESYHAQSRNELVEVDTRKYKLIFFTAGFIAVLIIGLSGTYIYYINRKSFKQKEKELIAQVAKKNISLDMSEWYMKLVPVEGGGETGDIITFRNGKFLSAGLSSRGFESSNYQTALEDGRLVWETMQSGPTGTASWRGELDNERMTGTLSLRQIDSEPQDFSFESIKYRRKE